MRWCSRFFCFVALPAGLLLAGCVRKHHDVQTGDSIGAHVQRGKERLVNQNDLQQLALFYQEAYGANDRPPDAEVFKTSLKRDYLKLYRALQDGTLVLVPKVKAPSTAVLAYEAKQDLNGNRLVVRADGSVQLMNERDFQQALKQGG